MPRAPKLKEGTKIKALNDIYDVLVTGAGADNLEVGTLEVLLRVIDALTLKANNAQSRIHTPNTADGLPAARHVAL